MSKIANLLCVLCLSLPMRAQAGGNHEELVAAGESWPIAAEAVRAAASEFRPAVDWSHAVIKFRSQLRARTENARLRATGIEAGRGPNSIAVRMECRRVSDCAPFWAEMVFQGPEWSSMPGSAQANPAPATRSGTTPAKAPLVRPGLPALLLSQENGLRVSMRVMPLKRAAMGETVKVLDPETHRRFLARVDGANRVRSDLREVK
jgi:hypothetical protein